jgi:16S rRNA processing protein RimM
VALARVLRPRGNKGEVAAEVLTDFPERLTKLREVSLGSGALIPEPFRAAIKSCRLTPGRRGQAIFHFDGYASISDAEKLRGLEILIPIEQRVSLPARHYFVSDLIGCLVFEHPSQVSPLSSFPSSLATAPVLLGEVTDILFTGEDVAGTPILVVETKHGELLLPLAEDICTRIDTAARRIEVVLPEGLRQLNPNI